MKTKTFHPGDKIKLKTKTKTWQGTTLQSHDPEVILLKLKSGYNIGIRENEILDAKIILPAKRSNFTYHKVTEKEKKQIQQDSKKLLNEFASKLSKIKTTTKHHENESGTRDEDTGWKTDPEFRSITFANAPFVDKDSIVAEKGAWKK